MVSTFRRLRRRCLLIRPLLKNSVCLTTAAKLQTDHVTQDFRTSKIHPADHSLEDCGKFYSIPINLSHQELFKYGGWPTPFMELCSTFRESSLMVRKQGLEIVHYLKNTDYSNPINKYVIYGKPGTGKTLILSYILHYAFLSGFLIVHIPWVSNWLRRPKEVTRSEGKEGFVDININASEWLIQFKTQNSQLLMDNNLCLQNNYEWNPRDVLKAGDPLLNLVDLGIKRGKLASNVLSVVFREIKLLSKLGVMKTMVLIDGYNAFFHDDTNIKDDEGRKKKPQDISFMNSVLEITQSNWHNGAAVLTCDELAIPGHNKSELPLYQLTMKGFEFLFPFIPIEVTGYTHFEMMNQLRYYRDRRWLENQRGDIELMSLSSGNPYTLMKLVAPL